jgi:hypothetical protein
VLRLRAGEDLSCGLEPQDGTISGQARAHASKSADAAKEIARHLGACRAAFIDILGSDAEHARHARAARNVEKFYAWFRRNREQMAAPLQLLLDDFFEKARFCIAQYGRAADASGELRRTELELARQLFAYLWTEDPIDKCLQDRVLDASRRSYEP